MHLRQVLLISVRLLNGIFRNFALGLSAPRKFQSVMCHTCFLSCVQSTGATERGTRGPRNTAPGPRSTERGARNAEHGTRSTERGAWNAEHEVHEARSAVHEARYGAPSRTYDRWAV